MVSRGRGKAPLEKRVLTFEDAVGFCGCSSTLLTLHA